jgi:outer membrane protein OmpA-like peptidoglycan-associated protein
MKLKKFYRYSFILILFAFFWNLPVFSVPWENVDSKIEIKMRIPVELFPQFQRMQRGIFQPLDYNWRIDPRNGHYYPYTYYDLDQSYHPGYPTHFNDKYFQYYKAPAKVPLKEYYKSVPAPREGEKYLKDQGEIRFEKLGEIYFKTGSSSLTSKSRYRLSKIAQTFKMKKFSYINIKGYTDVVGSKSKNQRLGLARARRVAEFLEDLGVNMRNAYIGSEGESYQKTKLKYNRRAEIVGFYTPLPKSSQWSYDVDVMAYDKKEPSTFFYFILGLFFLAIIGVAVYFISTN